MAFQWNIQHFYRLEWFIIEAETAVFWMPSTNQEQFTDVKWLFTGVQRIESNVDLFDDCKAS